MTYPKYVLWGLIDPDGALVESIHTDRDMSAVHTPNPGYVYKPYEYWDEHQTATYWQWANRDEERRRSRTRHVSTNFVVQAGNFDPEKLNIHFVPEGGIQ